MTGYYVDAPVNKVVTGTDLLGECPRWSERDQQLYWVDIQNRCLRVLDVGVGTVVSIKLDEEIAAFCFTDTSDLLVALRSGIYLVDRSGVKQEKICSNPEDTRVSRFNDGRSDSMGRFWVGTIDEEKRGRASLYCLSEGKLCCVSRGFSTVNGVSFDEKLGYVFLADSPRRCIYRFHLRWPDMDVTARDTWVSESTFERIGGRPDGAAFDEEGYYWTALYAGGAVARFSPSGRLNEVIRLPARYPTMCAFGGADGKSLYVTSAASPVNELERGPADGGLFEIRVSVRGVREHAASVSAIR